MNELSRQFELVEGMYVSVHTTDRLVSGRLRKENISWVLKDYEDEIVYIIQEENVEKIDLTNVYMKDRVAKVIRFDSTEQAYDACQTGDACDGDILFIESEGVIGISDCWPFAITVETGALHGLALPEGQDLVIEFQLSITKAKELAKENGLSINPQLIVPYEVAHE
jgi:hypothetical protein